ncbi:peptidylprolyl isomerase [Vagococcus sp.]|uniref:peptidylprolyl isomerase n=1 Tax=Vagococcus sp. TaxID=1933889 RepID=UPI003F9751BA
MKKKVWKLASITLLSALILTGCSSAGGKDVVTMKGGKVTQEEFYNELKKDDQSKQVLTGMILKRVALDGYGKDVSEKEIDKEYKAAEKQYGGKKVLEETLKQYGMDVKTFKENIKTNLAQKAMMESHIKITDADLKETWKTFHPDVDVQIISVDKEDEAKEILKSINDGGDFSKIAKEKSVEQTTKNNDGKLTFNSTQTTKPENVMLPDAVKDAAYKLEDGKVSEVITAQNPMTGADSFYIVKMVKNSKKGNDYKPFKKELTEITKETKLADPTFQQKVLGEELEKAKVKIDDPEFKDILTPYLPQKEEKKEDKKADTKDSKKEDKKETTESTK